MFDLRNYSKNDFLSKCSVFSNNRYDVGGIRGLRILRKSHKVEGNQGNIIGLMNYAHKVEGDQVNGFGLMNYAHKVERDQGNIIGLMNYAHKVERDQVNGFGLMNYAHKVEGNQVNIIGLMNYAHKVERDQGNIIGLMNYAHKVERDQVNGLFCIQTQNKKARQKDCLIRYNPLEGIGIGNSVWSKIENAEKYLNQLESRIPSSEYKKVLDSFICEKPSLIKRITGHNTRKDILSRQAKKRLNTLII